MACRKICSYIEVSFVWIKKNTVTEMVEMYFKLDYLDEVQVFLKKLFLGCLKLKNN